MKRTSRVCSVVILTLSSALLVLGTAHAALVDLLLPGSGSRSLEDLDPRLRLRVERVLGDLKKQGLQPLTFSTYRSPERQDFIYDLGLVMEHFSAARMTRAQGGESCHNAVDEQGMPAAMAVDIVDGNQTHDVQQRVRFYRALGKSARKHGLIWGGDWPRRNPTWSKHDIGWDPGHLQSKRCWRSLRQMRRTKPG